MYQGRKRKRYVYPSQQRMQQRLENKLRRIVNKRTGGFQNIETKFVDSTLNTTIPNNIVSGEVDPATGCLAGITQGTSESNRIGRCAYVKSLKIRGHVYRDQSTLVAQASYCRLFLVLDKQTNGAQLSAEDVLAVPAISGLDTDAFPNLQYSDRFRILKTKVIKYNLWPVIPDNAGGAINATEVYPFTMSWKGNVKKEHSGTTNDVSSCTTNSFHLIAVETGAPGGSLKYVCRARFTD